MTDKVRAGEEAGILERLPNVLSIVYYDYEVRHAIVQDATEIIKEMLNALLAVKRCEDTAIRGKSFVNLAHLRKAMPLVAAAITRAGAKQ